MSDKQNIFQKLKGWFKSSKRRRIKQSTVSSLLFINAIIKKPDLMPIYKKSSAPQFKSILKNNRRDNDQDSINTNMNTEFNDIYGDTKHKTTKKNNTLVGDMKVSNDKKNKRKLKKNSINNSDEKDLIKNKESDEKDISSLSLASTDHYLNKSNSSFRWKNKKQLLMNRKEDTISRMNIFQKDSSFINLRKAAIKRFQNFKCNANEKLLRCSSDYSNILITPHMEHFHVLMDNTLKRYPSQCLLDISSLMNNESVSLCRKPSTSKESGSLIAPQFNSTEFSSTSETVNTDVSISSSTGNNITVVENRPLNRNKEQ